MDQLHTLQEWHQGIRISHSAHFQAAEVYEKRNLLLGIPVVVLSAITGTAVFTAGGDTVLLARVAVGLCSVAAAVLAGLQTFLRYSELALKHKAAAIKYGALRRELEEALATYSAEAPFRADFMSDIRRRWDSLDDESPVVTKKIYDPVAREFRKKLAKD